MLPLITSCAQDSLGGNCRTRMIAAIWAESEQIEETLATMRFAARMMRVKTRPSVNIAKDNPELVEK